MGRGAPRAGFVNPHSGGPGSPSVPTTGDCLEWLDAAGAKADESWPDEGGRSPAPARKHGPGDKNRRQWSAGKRASRRKREAARFASVSGGCASRPGGLASLRVCRRSAPLFQGTEWTNGLPGATQTTRAMALALTSLGHTRVMQWLSHSGVYISLISPRKIAKRVARQLAGEHGGGNVAGKTIQAAGGIVVRGAKRALFAVVQRSKDDHWVLPRGKLKRDENPVAAARREVVEETGHRVTVNEFLGAITYRAGGRPKVVEFWQMQAEDEPSHELMADIVAVEWLPLKAAVRRLSYQLEKLFLINVGPRAAQHRRGRKLPPRSASKKAGKKATAKARKRTAKKSKGKIKSKAASNTIAVKTKHKGNKGKKQASARARRAVAHKPRTPQRHLGIAKPVSAPANPIAAKPHAKPVSAAERKGILQRMLGRLGA